MTDIVVIGASGFLGRQLVHAFQDSVVVGTFFQRALPGLVFLDLRNPRQLQEMLLRLSPSLVLYAAGLTDVDACEANPDLAWRLNVDVVEEIAQICDARLVYFSTDYVFDGKRGLYQEEDAPSPLSVYGQSKVAGERVVLSHRASNLVVRVSGLYDSMGIRDLLFKDARCPDVNEDLRISSPVHAQDVAAAARFLVDGNAGGIYHVAGPDRLSRFEFWKLVTLHTAGPLQPQSSRSIGTALRPRDSSLRIRRMEALGWRARSVSDGVNSLLSSRTQVHHKKESGIERRQCGQALMIDCVGALLTPRTWLPQDASLDAIDRKCAAETGGSDFWERAAAALGLSEADIPDVLERITFRYAPNPPIWDQIASWRTEYQLALVNNGPAATFRLWVRKYGLDRIFDVLVNSEELGERKPSMAFFRGVSDRLGIPLGLSLLIDDDPAIVEGAIRCNLRAVQTFAQNGYPLSIHALDTLVGHGALLKGDRNA